VLPEAKVPFLLKDLKKRDQILAKLATLPNDWTTYIPPKEVVPIIPPTTVEEAVLWRQLIVKKMDCMQ
jgi:hypothetical protein